MIETNSLRRTLPDAQPVVILALVLMGVVLIFPMSISPVGDASANAEGYEISEIAVSVAANGQIAAHDRSNGTVLWEDTASASPKSVHLSGKNELLYVGDGTELEIRDPYNGSVLETTTIQTTDSIQYVKEGPNGEYIYLTTGTGEEVNKVDAETGSVEWQTSIGSGADRLLVTDNALYVTGGGYGTTVSLDFDGTIRWDSGLEFYHMAYNDENGEIYGAERSTGDLVRVDPSDGSISETLYSGSLELDDVIETDNKQIFAKIYDGTNDGLATFDLDGNLKNQTNPSVSNTNGEIYTAGGDYYFGAETNATRVSGDLSVVWTNDPYGENIYALSVAGETPAKVNAEVVDSNGDPVDGAAVEVANDSAVLATGTTGADGKVQLFPDTDIAQDVDVSAEAQGTIETETVFYDPNGSDVSVTVQLDLDDVRSLDLEPDDRLINNSKSTGYSLTFTNESGTFDVTNSSNATVVSTNTSVVTVDEANNRLIATSDENISARVTIEANWTDANGTEYTDEDYAVVSDGSLEDILILPPVTRFPAFLANGNVLTILVGTLAGIVGARWTNAFGGIGLMTLTVVAGWFAGFTSGGIMLVTVFVGSWLGLNLAANIDYEVQQ